MLFKILISCLLFFILSNCSSSEIKEEPSSKTTSVKAKEKAEPSSPPSNSSVVSDEVKSIETKESIKEKPQKKIDKDVSLIKPNESKQNSDSGLKAGFADDNKQFNYFLNFLEKFSTANHIPLNIKERIFFKVKDSTGKTVSNAKVEIKSGLNTIAKGTTYSDGTFIFFPSEYPDKFNFKAIIKKNKSSKEVSFDRQGLRNIEITLDTQEYEANIPLEILFILDTTGSMGGEIARLKNTIELINLNLSDNQMGEVKFGMVLYRDKGDEYRTKKIQFTSDIEKFKIELDKVAAGGGGDIPEDLQEALKESINEMDWSENAIKLGFIITDAPPHLDYDQKFSYIKAMKSASESGIKLFSIGTGGLDINGEYVLRQISQYTYAKYIFLTYGEKGESDGGTKTSVSHHTGNDFPTDKLESIIIRFAKEEIANAKGKPLQNSEEYFSASKISNENKTETLSKLNEKSISQLIDYSSFNIVAGTTIAILPYTFENKSLQKNAEYFVEQSLLAFLKNKTFKVVERKDLQKVLSEWKLNLQAVDEKNAIEVGKLLGAKILCLGKIYLKENNFEIYLKLVHSETGEIQSATKLIIDKKLGL